MSDQPQPVPRGVPLLSAPRRCMFKAKCECGREVGISFRFGGVIEPDVPNEESRIVKASPVPGGIITGV